MVEIVRRLIVTGLALGAIAGNANKITAFYDETVENARHLTTVADLRSISNMLDYHFMKTGQYPHGKDFLNWLRKNFKESPLQTLGLDHWGNPLIYRPEAKNKAFVLISMGSDGLMNTSDDLRATGP